MAKLGWITSFLCFSTFICFTPPVHADVQETCGNDQAGVVSYAWCIDAETGSNNPDVLYYFHGAGGSEHSWLQDGSFGPTRAEWDKTGGAPRVVIISFGTDWLLNDDSYTTGFGFNYHPALYTPLLNQIMPAMEQRLGGIKGRRLLLGESMGGFNAAQLLVRRGDLFARVALVCPALMTVGPYSSSGDIQAYKNRHSPYLNSSWVNTMIGWFGDVYPNYNLWQNENPLAIVNNINSQSPPLYVSYGQQDDFGFNEGGQAFADAAKARGESVAVVPVSGGHCSYDPIQLAHSLE